MRIWLNGAFVDPKKACIATNDRGFLLGDGLFETMVMAGLLKEETKRTMEGLPGIKDVPVLGALARSNDFRNNQSELVVIVTPYLVGPVNKDQLKTPLEGFAEPSDTDSILMGRLNAVYGRKDQPAGNKQLQGPVGFIVK